MSIKKAIEQKNSRQTEDINKAQEIYNKQFKNINAIVNTDWYKEIRNYWKSEQEIIQQQILVCNPDQLRYLQAKYTVTTWFNTFLQNLEDKINWKV